MAELDARHLLTTRAVCGSETEFEGYHLGTAASMLMRIVHETELRDGVFLGHGRVSEPHLQQWGAFRHTRVFEGPLVRLAGDLGPVPEPGTAAALAYADLSEFAGHGYRFVDEELDAQLDHPEVLRDLVRIDHEVEWGAERTVSLDFALVSGATRGFMERPYQRIHVPPGTVLEPC